MTIVTVQKTVTTPSGEEYIYTFSAHAETLEEAESYAFAYASMVEYGMIAGRWEPGELPFPEEQLYQFIQYNTLETLKGMYPNVVPAAYGSALAYVKSYIGAMFDVDAMLEEEDLTFQSQILRLALCISTATFILASSPQYTETVEQQNKQLHQLLRGLKAGSRNMGREGLIAEPDVRLSVVSLTNTGQMP